MWPIHRRPRNETPRDGYLNILTGDPNLRGWAWLHSWRWRGIRKRLLVGVRFDMAREAYRTFPSRHDLDWLFAPRLVSCNVMVFSYERSPRRDPVREIGPVIRWSFIDYQETASD